MNVQVVCVSSRIPAEPYYHYREFIESLGRFDVVPINLGEGQPWRGLMTKPYLLREWLRKGGNTSDRLIVCDAWDIVFTQHPHGIGDKCADGTVIFNGEKGCWPREDLKSAFEDEPDTSPWKYLNSGFFCGMADDIVKLLEEMDIESVGFDPVGGPYPNDQGEYQSLFARQSEHGVPMYVDRGCHLSQTLSACDLSEFDFSGEPKDWKNVVTGTTPGVWHLNGGAKEVFGPTIFGKMGLS